MTAHRFQAPTEDILSGELSRFYLFHGMLSFSNIGPLGVSSISQLPGNHCL